MVFASCPISGWVRYYIRESNRKTLVGVLFERKQEPVSRSRSVVWLSETTRGEHSSSDISEVAYRHESAKHHGSQFLHFTRTKEK